MFAKALIDLKAARVAAPDDKGIEKAELRCIAMIKKETEKVVVVFVVVVIIVVDAAIFFFSNSSKYAHTNHGLITSFSRTKRVLSRTYCSPGEENVGKSVFKLIIYVMHKHVLSVNSRIDASSKPGN